LNTTPENLDDARILELGREAFAQQAREIARLGGRLDESYVLAVRALLDCRGRVIVTGLGKSGIVARKIAATLTSTGTGSHYIHPVEAAHGDLGIVGETDIMIAVSRSGNNPEVTDLVARARRFGMTLIAITGGEGSELARMSDIVLDCAVEREACPLNLTPTTSSTAALVTGDALAVALLTLRGFDKTDFASFHPSGVLGRSLLLRAEDLMHKDEDLPLVQTGCSLRDVLPVIVAGRLGCACVVDGDGVLEGICVDGDVKRILMRHDDPLDKPIDTVMSRSPLTITPDTLALTALRLMEKREEGPVTLLIVVDADNRPQGVLHIHDILRSGIL
jgi:arabinose-5-phosphate isomerase